MIQARRVLPSSRRSMMAGAVALGMMRPFVSRGAAARTLRFIPQADLTILDPLGTTAYVTRNHGHLCWDTLYGLDAAFTPSPQLAAGHVMEDDGKRWTFTLRDGPTFHDGEQIRAVDAVASIRGWMPRDTCGELLAQRLAKSAHWTTSASRSACASRSAHCCTRLPSRGPIRASSIPNVSRPSIQPRR